MTSLAPEFEQSHPGIRLQFLFGASGTLATQIGQGAPVDAFVSAAVKPMDQLEHADQLADASRVDLLTNRLVLITPTDGLALDAFEAVGDPRVARIAIGDPATVPAGAYAMEVFDKLGVAAPVREKAVYGKDVRAVLAWIETGDADAGVVYASDACQASKVVVAATADPSLHTPIVYPGAIVRSSPHAEAAALFLAWLADAARDEALTRYGFSRP